MSFVSITGGVQISFLSETSCVTVKCDTRSFPKYWEIRKGDYLISSVKNYITFLNRNEGKSEIYYFSIVSRVTRSGL
jgi:hypothetical protein